MKKLNLKIDAYVVVARAVEGGVAYGYGRAHKHSDEPGPELIKEEIEKAVMNALCEVVKFD